MYLLLHCFAENCVGIQLVEIDLQVIDMAVAQTTRKMVMGRKEAMTETVVRVEVLIDMEAECQLVMKEGVIGVDLVLMTAQAGLLVHHHLTATDCYCCMLVFPARDSNAGATLGT
jgi:hypothetical protein